MSIDARRQRPAYQLTRATSRTARRLHRLDRHAVLRHLGMSGALDAVLPEPEHRIRAATVVAAPPEWSGRRCNRWHPRDSLLTHLPLAMRGARRRAAR